MNEDQIKELERRNKDEQSKVNDKLDSIERAIRGTNGDPGLVGDVREIKNEMMRVSGVVSDLQTCIYGDPKNKDDKGIKGEQRVIVTDIKAMKEHHAKTADQRLWVNRAVIGAALGILADVLLRIL